ncbi:GNAT family N-acetyltransferase [Pelagibius sp. CAU 1746]|uniref:GNAT family N-acetyltransferase n=1 Tax=Pelagibius sp. CAU 1746 TaxID=3140370 RepID=UPI00325BB8BD
MALTDAPAAETLTQAAVEEAMALSEEAGWNQLPADWGFFFDHGRVFGLRKNGALIGTAAILPYGEDFAWLSMVLVKVSERGRGAARRLLQHGLQALEGMGRAAVLDATPAGERVYRDLGFDGERQIERWEGFAEDCPEPAGNRTFLPIDTAERLAAVIALDAAAFGAERGDLLTQIAARLPQAAWTTADGRAFVLGRDGASATQLGPLIAEDDKIAEGLLSQALAKLRGPVFIDIAGDRPGLAAVLAARGFRRQRTFRRMVRGQLHLPRATALAAIAGPEFG